MKGKRRTLADMQSLAATRGGTCLSDTYKHGRHPLRWRCADNHEWSAPPNSVAQGAWCPTCAGRPQYTLSDMQALAAAKGGTCLSPAYLNSSTPLDWRCAHNHTFSKTPAQVRQGNWCPTCHPRGRRPLTLEAMQELAASKGGTFVSTAYHGVEVKHTFRCDQNHEWDALPKNVRQGSWCPICAIEAGVAKRAAAPKTHRLPGSLERMQALAAAKGGTCLSTAYTNNYSDLRWRCAHGHEWSAKPYNIQRGSWCPTCFREHRSAA